NPGNALTVSDMPDIASPIPSDDDLAELEDVVVGRLAKFGIVEVRIRRMSAGPDGTQRRQAVPADPDIGEIEHAFLALSARFSQSDKLAASIEFRDGQWLNFVMP